MLCETTYTYTGGYTLPRFPGSQRMLGDVCAVFALLFTIYDTITSHMVPVKKYFFLAKNRKIVNFASAEMPFLTGIKLTYEA